MSRPVVIYVEEDWDVVGDLPNTKRDTLLYLLRTYCGCDVVTYQSIWEFRADIWRVRKLAESKRIVLFMVCQQEDMDDHKVFKRIVRRRLASRAPIVIVSDVWGKKRARGSFKRKTFVYWHGEEHLVELAKRLADKHKPSADWYGMETISEQAVLYDNLHLAYFKNYLVADDGMGVPDVNGMVVAEALRLRLLPSELVKEEFDDAIWHLSLCLKPSRDNIYDTETQKIREMTEGQRRVFEYRMRDVFGHGVSLGDRVRGYAIDPITLEYLIIGGFGSHRTAKIFLPARIREIESFYRPWWRFPDDGSYEEFCRQCEKRIVAGLILDGVEGFATPILMLDDYEFVSSEHLRKVANHLYRQKQLIPVDQSGYLIEG